MSDHIMPSVEAKMRSKVNKQLKPHNGAEAVTERLLHENRQPKGKTRDANHTGTPDLPTVTPSPQAGQVLPEDLLLESPFLQYAVWVSVQKTVQ